MSQRNKQAPTTWDALERGRASSFGSLESIVEDEPQPQQSTGQFLSQSFAPRVPQDTAQNQDNAGQGRRRSSFTGRLDSIRRMGGVNSIDNFVNSFQRAAAFNAITPVRRGSITREIVDEEEPEEVGNLRQEQRRPALKSLLSEQFQGAPPQNTDAARVSSDDNTLRPQATETTGLLTPIPSHQQSYSVRSRLESEQNLGVSYGSISSKLSQTARRRASILIQQQIEASQRARDLPEEYKDDILERPVETEVLPDGEVIERTVGESTVPMTIFNSTNVLIGVGILALPLGVRYSGWVLSGVMLVLIALVTCYTAHLLAKCLDTSTASTTYGDIAFLAFGDIGRSIVEVVFVVELTAANVALIVLFVDSMHSLLPALSILAWKVLLTLTLLPLNFVPFKILSVTSILGIVCVMSIIALVVVDGFIKPEAPGSLRQVSPTYAFPENWKLTPLSLGLFMAPWGGHSVFPAIYKDMRHPKKYGRAVRTTYGAVFGLNAAMGIVGYLMFGDFVRDEITANIFTSKAYPKVITIILIVLIAIIPITKMPLTSRPIIDTVNKKFLIDLRQMDVKARAWSERSLSHRLGRATVGILTNLVQLGVAIGFPDFDSIMALMGSALCFTICVVLPVSFYLKIFSGSDEIKFPEKVLCWVLIIISSVLAVLGTVFACMPKERLGVSSCDGLIGCLF